MANHLTTRERVKREIARKGSLRDSIVDRAIAARSSAFERATGRYFLPRTETRLYPWLQRHGLRSVLMLDADLLGVTALKSEAQDATPTVIPSADYFLEPVNNPPYQQIEIDLSSSSYFASNDSTTQRSISVEGVWAVSQDTEAAGQLAAQLATTTATTLDCTDASLIDVGDTLLIESERLFVTERSALDTTATLNGSIAADKAVVSITVSSGALVKEGEVILVDSERMFVTDVVENVLTVERSYDGTVLVSHSNSAPVYAYRRLTVERNVNGSTPATHASTTAIRRYLVEPEAESAVRAMVIADLLQGEAGWGREVGAAEGAREFTGRDVRRLWLDTVARFRRYD